jgi:Tfp pilus assembly protein PilF
MGTYCSKPIKHKSSNSNRSQSSDNVDTGRAALEDSVGGNSISSVKSNDMKAPAVKQLIATAAHYKEKRQLGQAQELLEKATEEFPECALAHSKLGDLYLQQSRHDLALQHCHTAKELAPDDADVLHSLGHVLLNTGAYKESLAELARAVELNPRYAKAHNTLGNVYRKLGESAKAVKHYIAAIEHTPKRKAQTGQFAVAHLNLAATYFDSGDTASALRHFDEALQASASIHKVMVAKGYHFIFKNPRIKEGIEALLIGDLQEAEMVLSAVQAVDPMNLVVNYYLATVFTKQGNHDQARPLYKSVMKLGRLKINFEKHFIQHFVSKAERALRRYPPTPLIVPTPTPSELPSKTPSEADELESFETPRFRSEDSVISERSSVNELITENQCLLF